MKTIQNKKRSGKLVYSSYVCQQSKSRGTDSNCLDEMSAARFCGYELWQDHSFESSNLEFALAVIKEGSECLS